MGGAVKNLRAASGFTLVELLAAIGVIGLLAALLLPAVMAARSSARKTQCHDHLKQLALAATSYQSAHRAFPFTTDGGRPPRSISPQALLLPYLELQSVYSTINFSETGAGSGEKPTSTLNGPLLSLTVEVFLCPDDKRVAGANSYRANIGVMPSPMLRLGVQIPNLPTERNIGAFRIFRALNPAQFTDGLANTAMFSEKLIGSLDATRFDAPRDCFFSPIEIQTPDDAVLVCRNPPSLNPPHDAFGGTTWLLGGFSQTWYNHILPPDSPIADCATNHAGGPGAYTARSFHAGGANVALADGSVRLISGNVDLSAWRALGTSAGGDAAGKDF